MKKLFVSMVLIVGVFVTMMGVVAAVNGANSVTQIGDSTHGPIPGAGNNSAIAGNVTELTIASNAITKTWAGYFGNVSGTISLENSNGDVMYNWSALNPSGEVLASTGSNVDWASIACADESNMISLETSYNIGSSDVDGIQETFSSNNDLTIAGQSLTQCNSTRVFNNTGSASANFEEALLWDGANAVFASILTQDSTGFDSKSHDFEMLVLEDGHGTDTNAVDYYFYVELN